MTRNCRVIGLDFDNVICDSTYLKSKAIKETLGLSIKPSHCKKEIIVAQKIISSSQYSAIQKMVYDTTKFMKYMRPVEDAVFYLKLLRRAGYKLIVITSRNHRGEKIAQDWLSNLRLADTRIISAGRNTKIKAAEEAEVDCYVDDDLDKLIPLVGHVPHLFLFSWPYNSWQKTPGIKRVKNWRHLYAEITK